jgi:hypothetical protein
MAVAEHPESGLLLGRLHFQVIRPGPVKNAPPHFNPFSLRIIFLLPELFKTILSYTSALSL